MAFVVDGMPRLAPLVALLDPGTRKLSRCPA